MPNKAIFYVFFCSYAFAALYFATGLKIYFPLSFALFTIVYMWIPGVVSLILAKKENMKFSILKWDRFLVYAGLVSVIISSSVLVISSFLAQGWNPLLLDSKEGIPIYFLITFILGITLNAVFALGQELFWRGYLQSKWKSWQPASTSLIIGILWGIWYAPLIALGYNYPIYSWAGILMMILVTISLSPFLYYLREKSDSLAAPTIFHGIFIAFSGLSSLFFMKMNHFLMGNTGIIGILFFSIPSIWSLYALRKIP